VKRLHLGAEVARTHIAYNGHSFPWRARRRDPSSCIPNAHALGPFDPGAIPEVAVERLWLEVIGCPATTFVVVDGLTYATAQLISGAERRRGRMASALAGTFIILSIGILMAHAMDAFRSGS
jgi:hypothetical protein